MPFVTPGELDAGLDGRLVQVEGVVERVTRQADGLRIVISDGAAATVVVTYTHADHRRLTLNTGRIVVAKGYDSGGLVEASQVSVRAQDQ